MESTAFHYGITRPARVGRSLAPWAQLLERAGRLILGVVEAHVAARRAKATLEALEGLSAHELEDIGLTRGDLDMLAALSGSTLRGRRDLALYP